MKRIVVAVDFSDASLRAVDMAADLAAKYDAELMLLTVIPEFVGPDPGMQSFTGMEQIRPRPIAVDMQAMRDRLGVVTERATTVGAGRVSSDVSIGDPAEQLLAHADAANADLIVLGSRGHGRLAGLLLGSVAQKIVTHARCAVLVVH